MRHTVLVPLCLILSAARRTVASSRLTTVAAPGAVAAAALLALAVPTGSLARKAVPEADRHIAKWSRASSDRTAGPSARRTDAMPADTLVLGSWTFDANGCTPQGWTAHDMTIGTSILMTHVDDFAGLGGGTFGRLHAIGGARSMWCGLRPDAAGLELCSYAALPGYGNSMDQRLTTRDCLHPTGDVVFDYYLTWDVEPGYDFVGVEIDHCDDQWAPFPTGSTVFTGVGVDSLVSLTIPAANHGGQMRIGIRVSSDGAWSDEDGLFDSDGAYVTDDLLVSDQNGVVVELEDFESAPLGATEVADWVAGHGAADGYGIFAGVLPGAAALQQGDCVRNPSCIWAFYVGSTYNYACGGHPEQAVVPFVNGNGQYFSNEIRSPWVENIGTGTECIYEFDLMGDLPLDNLVFFVPRVRSLVDGCPGDWRDENLFHFEPERDWLTIPIPVGGMIEPGATHIQLAFAVQDRCGVWCGTVGTGVCHSNGPLFDNPRLLRVNVQGPRWSNFDFRQFQDNFATDGTLTGTVRADMAADVLHPTNPNILPGDSAVVRVSDPEAGLATGVNGGADVRIYVSVQPYGQAGKGGAGLSGDLGRFPHLGQWTDAGGVNWQVFQLDAASSDYCVDLNDNLFTPGDTVSFFYAARNSSGVETYAYGSTLTLQTDDRAAAAVDPGEFTCLPAGGYNRGGDILYVDGADGHGVQPTFDLAFSALGILDQVDRYDVRAPYSGQRNTLDTRVQNVTNQLLAPYRKIIWDTPVKLGDGTRPAGGPGKADDYGLLIAFLDGLMDDGGVYMGGDDLAQQLSAQTGPSAVAFRTTYLPFVLTANDHRPLFGISPVGTSTGGAFASDPTFIVQGGCPLINDFDVLTPAGSSVMEIAYGAPAGTNGAVLSNARVNGNGATAGVLLSGFSFAYIADDEMDGVSDRSDHLHDVITWLGNAVSAATGTPSAYRTSLSQNYPNPFNPQTTIAFSVKARGLVTLRVYNVAGERVRTLASEEFTAGAHTKVWDGRNDAGQPVSSGVYFYKLVSNTFTQTRKMVLLK